MSVGALALFLADQAAAAAATPELLEAVAKKAVLVAGGRPAAGVSPAAARLAAGSGAARVATPVAVLVLVVLGIVALGAVGAAARPGHWFGPRVRAVPPPPSYAPIQGFPVRPGSTSPLDFRAFPVEIDGRPGHALVLTEAEFAVDAQGRLTARMAGTVLPYAHVRMAVSAWVYDASGGVLATAVQRHPVEPGADPTGRVPVELEFDFGTRPRLKSVVRVTLTAWPA